MTSAVILGMIVTMFPEPREQAKAIGLAVLATLSSTRSGDLIDGGTASLSALTSGYHLAFVVATALVLVAIIVAVGVLQPVRQAEARPATADRDGRACANRCTSKGAVI